MKRALTLTLALLIILFSGCTNMPKDNISSADYYDYIYENGTEYIDSIASEIESDINDKVIAGEATVSEIYSSYVTDSSDEGYLYPNEAGKQNAVIDSTITSDNAKIIDEADINTTGSKPLYYTYLNPSQQRIYRIMKTAAEQMTTGLFSLDAVSSKEDRITDIAIAFRALSSDNPQIFWLPGSYITSPDGSKLAFSYKNLDYTFTAEEKLKAEQKVNDVVGRLTSQAQKLNSRFEKELFFHNWLCENVSYNNDGTDDIYTVYGALINGVAVCEGYARAMQLLCDSVGIPCTVTYGFLNGVGHMWNIIDPGDGWYHLDVTCDDDEEFGYVRYAYFNFSDELILLDHTLFDAVVLGKSYIAADCFNIYLYNCNSADYNYFIKKNLIFNDNINDAAQLILNAVSKGQTSIELLYMCSNKDYKYVLSQVNQALYNSGSSVFVKSYSPLGNSIVLRW